MNENGIVISVDRKKGDPNREVTIELYSYESTGGTQINISNNQKTIVQDISSQKEIQLSVDSNRKSIFVSSPSDREVKILLYDITGRVTKSYFDGIITQGVHTFQLSGLQNGTYFVMLKTNNCSVTKKVLVIK